MADYFISDLHLGCETRERELFKENLLLAFLDSIKGDASHLFIVGDLFDYWFEYRRVYQKGFFRTLSKLYELTSTGVQVHYFIGNHDFMHRDFFEREIGVTLQPDSMVTELNGKRLYIAHGDGLIANDLGYNILKKILRNKTAQFCFGLIHPDLGIKIASASSKTSRDYTAGKNYGAKDSLFEVAKQRIDEGIDIVIFGHSHIRRFESFGDGQYVNLGSWLQKPCYAKFDKTGISIIDLI
jgi:UDP-2,3-diacylglucosamine hydrolase